MKLRSYLILSLSILFFSTNSLSQKCFQNLTHVEGSIEYAPDISIPMIDPGYTLWMPDNLKANGLIVFTHPRTDTVEKDLIINYATEKGLAILYTNTNNRLEFLFDEERIRELESYIIEACKKYSIPKENMLYCGMSLEGTRALKLASYSLEKRSLLKVQPKAIAICDAPLDMIRFHREIQKTLRIKFNPIATNEATWVGAYLEKNLGGTPKGQMSAYVEYSPFCYSAGGGLHLEKFKGIAIRAYTEPDVNWWIENRRKDYYAMNAIDLAGLVNDLRILGNDKAEYVPTVDKGYREDGSRHPHSWNIVDEKELIDWFLALP